MIFPTCTPTVSSDYLESTLSSTMRADKNRKLYIYIHTLGSQLVVHLYPSSRPAGCPPPSQLVVHLVFRTAKIGVWGHIGFFLPTCGFGEIYGSGGVRLLTFRVLTHRGTQKKCLGVHKVFFGSSNLLPSTVDCVKKTREK